MRNLFSRILLAGVAASALSATACTGSATVAYTTPRARVVAVRTAPPAPVSVYYDDRPGYVYVQGRWVFDNGQWRWMEGRYVRERGGFVFHQGYWDYRDGGYVWINPYWERQRPGHIYARGYWDYRGGRYVYMPGQWQRSRGDGYVWIEGRWAWRNGHRVYMPGRWVVRARVRDERIYTAPRRY